MSSNKKNNFISEITDDKKSMILDQMDMLMEKKQESSNILKNIEKEANIEHKAKLDKINK